MSYEKRCSSYGLHSLIKQPTFYKNPKNPRCTDLILTNNAKYFICKKMCYKDRITWFSQNDHLCIKNAFLKTTVKSY